MEGSTTTPTTSRFTSFLSRPVVLISIVATIFVICVGLSVVALVESMKAQKAQKVCECSADGCKCSDDACKCDISPDAIKKAVDKVTSGLSDTITQKVSATIPGVVQKAVDKSTGSISDTITQKVSDKIPGVVTTTLKNNGMTVDDDGITFSKIIKASNVQADKVSALSSPDDSFINLGLNYINIENRRSEGFVRMAALKTDPVVTKAYDWSGDTEYAKYVNAWHGTGSDYTAWTPGFSICSHNYSPNPQGGHGACPLPGYDCTEDGGHCIIP